MKLQAQPNAERFLGGRSFSSDITGRAKRGPMPRLTRSKYSSFAARAVSPLTAPSVPPDLRKERHGIGIASMKFQAQPNAERLLGGRSFSSDITGRAKREPMCRLTRSKYSSFAARAVSPAKTIGVLASE